MHLGLVVGLAVWNCDVLDAKFKGSPNPDSTIESKPPIYCVLLMWHYIYRRERERNQDSKSYLDSKSSRKSRMNVRETSVPYKPK